MPDKTQDAKLTTTGRNSRPRGKTRERLLEAGCKLFSQMGFDGTTIGDLEEEAGLKPGTGSFYRHFRNKEELLDEVIAHETEKLNQIVAQRAKMLESSLGNTRADLLLKFRMRLMGLRQVKDFINILVREENRFTPEQMQAFRTRFVDQPHERDTRGLQKLIRAGEVVDGNPKALARVITDAIMGHFLIKRYYRMDELGGVSDEEFSSMLADLVTGSLSRKKRNKG